MKTTNCIKIDSTAKGYHHWEDHLLVKQKLRLNKLLVQLEVDPWKKREVFNIFKRFVTRENIIKVYAHPIRVFLFHLINNSLDKLETYSSIQTPKTQTS